MADTSRSPYRGRFAPTPSGPLHLGSLVTAVASWLDARAHGGEWLVRVDDLDPPREVPGAADTICAQLVQCGLHADTGVIYQSQRSGLYQQAVDQLLASGDAFYCTLSRKDLAARDNHHPGPSLAVPAGEDRAIRLAVPDAEQWLDDAWHGRFPYNLEQLGGAFVIRRRDGLFAYQLACAVDDAALGITHVVRGDDLLPSTPQQLHVLTRLGKAAPRYAHLPVVRDAAGDKLSKSAGSAALDMNDPAAELARALACLSLPHDASAHVETQLKQALAAWRSPFTSGSDAPDAGC